MNSKVILTVAGSDRPGLTQALADAVMAADGNWLESHLATLGGKYVGSVLVELPDGSRGLLHAKVREIDAQGLTVTVLDASDEDSAGRTLSLELVGGDRLGIVREVTTMLARLGVNIDDLDTSIETGAQTGAAMFRAHAKLRLPDNVQPDEVIAALEEISGEIMVDLTFS